MKEIRLVRKARKGSQKALEELLILHSEQLYRTAFIYTKNREDALDIVQEASYRAFLSIENLRNESFFLTWLTKIVIHCAYDLLGRRKKEIAMESLIELPVSKKEKREEHLDLIDAINQLKRQYRDVIVLFYFQDFRISEVAEVMKIPENTVKTYLRRGKMQLKNELGGADYYEEGYFSKRI